MFSYLRVSLAMIEVGAETMARLPVQDAGDFEDLQAQAPL
jgi:hypothetical protein